MKKNILIGAICALFALGMTSCGTTDFEQAEKDLTGAKKGWVLTAATSSPAYLPSDGGSYPDLMDGYLYDFEKDDAIIYLEGGNIDIEPGKDLPSVSETGYSKRENIGKWSFVGEDTKVLNTQLPFFYDDEVEQVKVHELNSKKLRVSYTFIEDDEQDPAKATREYTFTLTYEPK